MSDMQKEARMNNRENVQFASGGLKCAGWLYRAGGGPRPCVVLAHGFGGTREMRLGAYAEAFVEAGYHALVFDYRHFGDSEGEPRQILDIKRQHEDWRAALRFARGIDGVDPEKMILWGTSFSGGHVVEVAARESGIAAVISQVPHLSGVATALAAGPVQSARLGLAAWRDLTRAALHRSPYYLRVVGRPGDLAAMTTPGAEEGVKRLYPESYEPDERVAARIFLWVGLYSPGRLAKRLTVPWLVQAASKDRTTLIGPAVRAAMKARQGQLVVYQCDHFDVYVPPRFGQVVDDQITFLRHSLK